MKLKALLALTAALSFGVAAAQSTGTTTTASAPVLSDVPAGHWAKDAVDRLVEQGIILGFPDGTYRGNENLTRYQAAVIIARLLDQMARGETTVSELDPETLESVQNAVQELAADLAALGVRVADLEENAATKDDIARIEERLDNLSLSGGDEGAVEELRAQIDDLTARVDELSSNFDAIRADVDDNASSIAALNDLTVLLNQDILSLQDRVSALESGDFVGRAEFEARVAPLENRVTALETGRVTITGLNFAINYGGSWLVTGAPFDIDRVDNTIIGNGDITLAEPLDADGNWDTSASSFPGFTLTVNNIGIAGGGFTVSSAAFDIGFGNNVFGAPSSGSVPLVLNGVNVAGRFVNNPFTLSYSASSSNFRFNEYLASNRTGNRRGVVLDFTGTELPFTPKLTVVVGNGNVNQGVETPYFGVRAVVNPAGVGTFGLNYFTAPAFRTAFGVDYSLTLIPGVSLNGVYAASIANGASFDTRDQAFDTTAAFAVGPVNLSARLLAISPGYTETAALSTDDRALPTAFEQDVFAYRVQANTTFSPFTLGFDFVGSNNYTNTGQQRQAFSVTAGAANLFAGFGLTVNYGSASLAGVQQTSLATPFGTYSTVFGVTLSHPGTAANSLVPGLNLNLAYQNFYDDTVGVAAFGLTSLTATAAYSTNVGGVTFNPFIRYNTVDAASNSTRSDHNTFKYGVQVSTALAGAPFSPTISGGVAGRTTNFTSANAGTGTIGTTSELFARAELGLAQLFSTNSTFSVGYSYYTGTNVTGLAVGVANVPFSTADNRVYQNPEANATSNNQGIGTFSGSITGIYAKFSYFGFQAAYGTYSLTPTAGAAVPSTVQGFKIGYGVKF